MRAPLRSHTPLGLGLLFLFACEGEVLTPASGFVATECPPSEPNCDRSGFTIDSGIGTAPDSGAPVTVEADAGVPQGGGVDSGLHPDAAGSGGVDAGVIDSGVTTQDAGPPPPPPEFLNLAGTHDVQYVFDLSDYLLGLNGIAGPLDFINRAFQGRLVSDPILGALVNPLVQNLAQQYIPSWVHTLIDVLSQVASFFDRVEVVATMNVSQGLPTGQTSPLHGDERWQRLSVQFINQCPFGYMDRNYPACAMRQIPIAQTGVTPVGPLDVEVTVDPFDGVLQAGRPQADFVFQGRHVDIDLYKLLSLAIDTALRLASNGQIPDLRSGLNMLIDCQGLANGVNNLLGGNVAAMLIVLNTCNNEKQHAIDAIIAGVRGVAADADFDFDQRGHAVDLNANTRADRLQEMSVSRSIDGSFQVLIGADLEGSWAAQNRSP